MSSAQTKNNDPHSIAKHMHSTAVVSVITAGLLVTTPGFALAKSLGPDAGTNPGGTPAADTAGKASTPNGAPHEASVAGADTETPGPAPIDAALPQTPSTVIATNEIPQAEVAVETNHSLTEQEKDEAVAIGFKVTRSKRGETRHFKTEAEAQAYAGTNGSHQREELRGLSIEEAGKLDESWRVTSRQTGETRYFASAKDARAYAGASGTIEHEVKGSLTKQEADALDSSWKVTKSDGETKWFSSEAAARKFAGTDGRVQLEKRTGLSGKQMNDALASGYVVIHTNTGIVKHFSTKEEADACVAKNGGTVAREERRNLTLEEAGKLDKTWKVTTIDGGTRYFDNQADAKAFAGKNGTVTYEERDDRLTEQEKDEAASYGWKVVNEHTGETRYYRTKAGAEAFAGAHGTIEQETQRGLSDAEKNRLDGTWQITPNGYLINGKKDTTLTPDQLKTLEGARSAYYSITRIQSGDTTAYVVRDADGNVVTDEKLADLLVSKVDFSALDRAARRAPTQASRYYLKDGSKKIYVNAASPITLSRDANGTYYVIDADGMKQAVSDAFVRSLASGATYSITGYYVNADGSLRHGDHGETLQKTIRFGSNAKVTVFRDGDDFYIPDSDGTFLKLFPSDASKVTEKTTPAGARTKMLNTDGSQASLKIRNDLANLFKELSITSDFVLYADTVDEGLHIDGNICVNELDGNDHSIEDLYASGRGIVSGLDQYSIVLNDANDAITFRILDSSIVAGTNIKAENKNNGFNKFGGTASATDVAHPQATDPNFNEAPEDVKKAINDAIAAAEADPAFEVKSTVRDHLADLIYTICQKEQISNPDAVSAYAKTILDQLQIDRTLTNIGTTSQQLINDSIARDAAKAGKGTNDYLSAFTSGRAQCQELLHTLQTKGADANSVFVVTLSANDLHNDGKHNNGVIGDNGLVEQIMQANEHIGATIIFNVIVPQGTTELNFDKNHVDNSYDEATGYYFWNFGSYSGHIQNDWTNEGTVVAGNASFTKGNGSRDGSVIARKITQRSEIHQAKRRSFAGDETSSYAVAPDTGYVVTPQTEVVRTTDPTIAVGRAYDAERFKATERLYDVARYKATAGASYRAERYNVTAPTTYDVARYQATNATYTAERFAGASVRCDAERYQATNELYDVEKTTVTFHNEHNAPTSGHPSYKHAVSRQGKSHQATNVTTHVTTEKATALPKTGDDGGASLGALAMLGMVLAGIGETLHRRSAHRA